MRPTDLGLKHPREISKAPYYNPQITYQGDSLKLAGKDYVKTRSKSFTSSRFYHPQLANNSTTLLVGPGRYVSELGTIKDDLKKHTTFVYKEGVVSSLNPQSYMMVGNSKVFFPEFYSPKQKRNSTPCIDPAKSIDYTVGYSTSTSKHLNSVMGTLMKNISNNDSQNASESTVISGNPSSGGASTARDGSKSSKRRTKNISVNLDSLLGSNSAHNSCLSNGNTIFNNDSENTSHEIAVNRPNSCKSTPLKNGSNTESTKKPSQQDRGQSMSTANLRQNLSKSSSQVSTVLSQNTEKPIANGQINLDKSTIPIKPKPIKKLGKIVSASTEKLNCHDSSKEKSQGLSIKVGSLKEQVTLNSTPKQLLIEIPISTKNQLHLEIASKNPFASFQRIQKNGANKEKMLAKKH